MWREILHHTHLMPFWLHNLYASAVHVNAHISVKCLRINHAHRNNRLIVCFGQLILELNLLQLRHFYCLLLVYSDSRFVSRNLVVVALCAHILILLKIACATQHLPLELFGIGITMCLL